MLSRYNKTIVARCDLGSMGFAHPRVKNGTRGEASAAGRTPYRNVQDWFVVTTTLASAGELVKKEAFLIPLHGDRSWPQSLENRTMIMVHCYA